MPVQVGAGQYTENVELESSFPASQRAGSPYRCQRYKSTCIAWYTHESCGALSLHHLVSNIPYVNVMQLLKAA